MILVDIVSSQTAKEHPIQDSSLLTKWAVLVILGIERRSYRWNRLYN